MFTVTLEICRILLEFQNVNGRERLLTVNQLCCTYLYQTLSLYIMVTPPVTPTKSRNPPSTPSRSPILGPPQTPNSRTSSFAVTAAHGVNFEKGRVSRYKKRIEDTIKIIKSNDDSVLSDIVRLRQQRVQLAKEKQWTEEIEASHGTNSSILNASLLEDSRIVDAQQEEGIFEQGANAIRMSLRMKPQHKFTENQEILLRKRFELRELILEEESLLRPCDTLYHKIKALFQHRKKYIHIQNLHTNDGLFFNMVQFTHDLDRRISYIDRMIDTIDSARFLKSEREMISFIDSFVGTFNMSGLNKVMVTNIVAMRDRLVSNNKLIKNDYSIETPEEPFYGGSDAISFFTRLSALRSKVSKYNMMIENDISEDEFAEVSEYARMDTASDTNETSELDSQALKVHERVKRRRELYIEMLNIELTEAIGNIKMLLSMEERIFRNRRTLKLIFVLFVTNFASLVVSMYSFKS